MHHKPNDSNSSSPTTDSPSLVMLLLLLPFLILHMAEPLCQVLLAELSTPYASKTRTVFKVADSFLKAGPKNWPILTDSGLAFNLLTLGPCGFFAPHIHPRANELFLVLEGEVNFGYILEATVFGGLTAPNPTINGTLQVQESTLFPMGSTHWQINASPTCNNATTFEAFSSDDEGAIIILNHVRNDDRVIIPTMNENDLGGLRAVLPPAILAEVDSCLARCNIHNDN